MTGLSLQILGIIIFIVGTFTSVYYRQLNIFSIYTNFKTKVTMTEPSVESKTKSDCSSTLFTASEGSQITLNGVPITDECGDSQIADLKSSSTLEMNNSPITRKNITK